ncbi:tautomerase family protein [Candidatus Dependentiae bacterium]|nr:tautomerase family protein [Candidatus Dependentiae bacterium]
MPAITVQSLELTDEQKKILAEKFAGLLSDLTKVPIDRIYVFFDGYTPDNCAKGNILFSTVPIKKIICKANPKIEE